MLRTVLSPTIGGLRFLTFFPAVIGCSLVAGPTSGLLATLLSAAVVTATFERAPGESAVIGEIIAISLFIAIGLMTVWLGQRTRRGKVEMTAADEARLRLAAIVESSDDSIVSKGLDGVVQSWNAGAARMYGYEAEEIVGKSIGRLVPPDLLAEQAAGVDRLRQGERIEPFETIRLHRSGTPLRVSVTMSPLRGPGGDVIGAVEIARDMGARLAAEADLRLAKSTAERTVGQLRAVIDSMSEGVVVADAEGNLKSWNRPALAAHGFETLEDATFSLANAVAKFELSVDGRALPLADWPMSRVLRGESFTGVEIHVRRIDKPLQLIIRYGGRPVYDHLGRLSLAVLTLQDVTAERLAQIATEETAGRLSLALSAAGLGDWEWDVDTDLVALSPAAAKVFGVTAGKSMTRESMRNLVHEDDRERTRIAAQQSNEQRTDYDMEYRVLRADGRMVWVAAKGRGQYGPDGRMIRMLGVVQDITPRKLAEQDLRNGREERELLLVAEQAARAHAEHASRMKDEFLATLSHELRTPLNAILGWSQILTATSPDAEELHQGLEVIERNARSQAKIIEDLLDMSRIISGRVRLETGLLDLPALAKAAMETVHPAADARGVALSFEGQSCDAGVVGDPARITQVLWNLLTNAIKFTPRGGEVKMALKQVGPAVELSVQDTGEGIRPDFLPFVFDRFRQADSSSSRRHGGLGLGLAIVKELAELHGGSVRVVSEGMAQGSTFTVALPIACSTPREAVKTIPDEPAAPTRAVANPPAGPAVSIEGLRVAVVDDEADARNLVRRVLEDRRAIVTTYESAAAAFDALTAANRPDVLVSDIGMPTEDGYSMIGRLRNAGVTIPAIALTAYARSEDRNRALAAGFNNHLSKPVEASELIALVAQCGDRTQPKPDTAGRAH